MGAKAVVFIHGMYMTPLCWEHWEARFQASGYQTLAPAWPGRDRSVQDLQTPDEKLGRLNLSDVLEHVSAAIQGLDEKPILIGHSMGGLVAQMLHNRGLASATIAIDSAPPTGVFTTAFSFLKANWPHITPFVNQSSPIVMTFERFQYAFVNGMSVDEQRAAFERYVVPESRRVPGESLFGSKVDFKKAHAPLLMIAGGNDHIIPAVLTRRNFRKYSDPSSVRHFKEFPGRNHFLLGQTGWEEIADHCLQWIASNSG